jgi:decaprenylphospho-beta-D-erythro-pentofuranosid-2-ulose 2-reductase
VTRRVLILGATSGIAQETSRCFAAEHARLCLVARDASKLEAVAGDLLVRGAEAVCILPGDLADDAARPAILSHALAQWGGLDAALIAYGVLPDQTVCEDDPEALRSSLEINWVSVAAWLMPLAKVFEGQRRGVLAVIGSVAGDRGRRSNYVYGSAKTAIETFVAGLRLRLAPCGVSVVLIKPGWVSTPMTAHLAQNGLYASPVKVGEGIYKAMLSGRPVAYLPWYWRWIMLLIRMIPERIFNKMKL